MSIGLKDYFFLKRYWNGKGDWFKLFFNVVGEMIMVEVMMSKFFLNELERMISDLEYLICWWYNFNVCVNNKEEIINIVDYFRLEILDIGFYIGSFLC